MQRKYLLITIITILIVLLTTWIGILTSYVSNFIDPGFKPFALPLLCVIVLVVAALTVWLYILQRNTDRSTLTLAKQNRQRMLARVYAFWIKGVLEQPLYGASLIALGLEEKRVAVANPWHLVFQHPDQPSRPFPPSTRITQVFDDAGGELLILGEPGSGKTTLLLDLARDLLERAKQDDTYPMPVVFNLSSWTAKKQPITNWLVDELNTKYQVPRKLGQAWVNTDQIVPLLDGLDEVDPSARMACVYSINAYRQEHLVPIAICSRSADYLAQSTRIILGNAVVIQPLTTQQIKDYLASAGEKLAAVRVALHKDEALQELTTTPLMLSVLASTYYGKTVDDLLAITSPEARRQQMFATYIQRMLQRRGTKTRYTRQKTTYWLSWLALQLVQHKQTEFHIERMQPDWLPNSRSRWAYRMVVALVTGLIAGLIIGLVFGLNLVLVFLMGSGVYNVEGSLFGQIAKFFILLFIGLSLGLPILLLVGLTFGSIGALIGVLIGALLSLFAGESITEIKPAEVIGWSWRKVRQNLAIMLIIGGGIGLGAGLGAGMAAGFNIGLTIGLVVGLGIILIIGLIRGLSGEMLDEHNFDRPNQGIRLSIRHSAFIFFSGLIVGLVAGLIGWWNGLGWELFLWSVIGTTLGLIIGLLNGGLAYIKHVCLRLFLRRYAPLGYPRFLNYAVERVLLRKIGGGYIFIHRDLLEYFASLMPPSSPTSSSPILPIREEEP